MFRDPKWSVTFDRPSNCLGIRSFIIDGWNFRSGIIGQWGFRILGVCLEVEWHWLPSVLDEQAYLLAGQQDQNEDTPGNHYLSDLLGGGIGIGEWGDTDDA